MLEENAMTDGTYKRKKKEEGFFSSCLK